MGGAEGARGYLLQTIICLLDSLKSDASWHSFSLEPDSAHDKVDLVWRQSDGSVKSVQVKSSQNQITVTQAKQWAAELEESATAAAYELVLIGPCSQGILDLGRYGRVSIPAPKALDVSGLVEQAAHRLDVYLTNRGIGKVPAFARELLTNALVAKLSGYSTAGAFITKDDFNLLLNEWLLAIYPRSVNEAVEMQCVILADTVVLPCPQTGSESGIPILVPVTLVNNGVRTAVIEWMAIKIVSDYATKRYTPITFVDYETFIQRWRKLHPEIIKGNFTPFAVLRDSAKELCVLFRQEPDHSYPLSSWRPGRHEFRLYVKYDCKDVPQMQKELAFYISEKELEEYSQGTSLCLSQRRIAF